ncbi:TPA: zinc-dependent alcohol dehydrogenase family protein [Pseudomonas aeruginosa]|nr:zinc-dependent alcohol dehydrogenase family protein [Pseudomonas aeruginosa]
MSRVIRFHQFGPPEVLKCEELPTPAPAAGEVLVRVQAIGVSWKDVLWRQNLAPEQAALPSGLGFELAGEVLAVGAGVGDLPLGSRVASFPAHTPDHYPAYGDVVLMPRAALAVYPEVLTPVEASVYYTGLLVAYFGLVDLAGLKAGQTVLITEAARMYGPVSIQLAKALGARVIASTKSAEEREFLREQGADKVVVTDEQDLVLEVERFTEGKGVNVILDELGGPQMTLLGDVSATRGKLVLYGCNGGNESAFPACAAFKKHLQFYRHCLMDFTGHPEMGLERNDESVSKALAHIEQLTRDRLLKPVVDRVFEFDQVVEAHRYMETCGDPRRRLRTTRSERARPSSRAFSWARFQIHRSLTAVRSPPWSPVLRTPQGSTRSMRTSPSANGLCSTPRGTTYISPGPRCTAPSRKSMRRRPARTMKVSSVSAWLCQTKSPSIFTSLNW